MKLTVLILYSVIFNSVYSLKLLIIFPVPARSHYILGNALSKSLANFGHEVTFIAPFSEPNPPKSLKYIVLKELAVARDDEHRNMFQMADISPFFQIFFLNGFGAIMTEALLEHPDVQKLLHSNEKFDAVIMEQFMIDALSALGHHYNAPLIIFSTLGPNRWVNNLVANPEPASYVPDIFLSTSEEMTFTERAYNLIFSLVSQLNLYYVVYPEQKKIAEKYFPGIPDFEKIHTNVSLVLLNSHESINQPVPHVPNMIDIGGYHVQPPKALPKDLQDFMDSAKEGVIYFSMGSNLVPSQMPIRTKNVILKVLGSRKEKILWKWDEDQLENKPSNVKISKWFPQQDILAHPNCKLFITHGGLLSTTETVTRGVPVLAFPIFGDQKLNARRAQSLGFGKSLEFSSITEEELTSSLNELLSNPKYKENAKLRSQLLKDRPVKPMELAEYWIKYVVRYNGAPHLRVAGIRLPFYKYWFLDVVAVFVGGLALSVHVLIKLFKYRKCKSAKKELKESSRKKRQ